MYCKFALAALAVIFGSEFVLTQQIPSTTTAAELWNPWTWFWPYAIASAEAYRDYYQKAQKATNELYQQIYKTNAFPLITGNWGAPQTNPPSGAGGPNNQTGNAGQPNQEGSGAQNNPGSTPQQNQEGSNNPNPQGNSTQTDPGTNEGSSQGGENQTPAEGSGAQVQGEVQGDGTADAEVNANVEEK